MVGEIRQAFQWTSFHLSVWLESQWVELTDLQFLHAIVYILIMQCYIYNFLAFSILLNPSDWQSID